MDDEVKTNIPEADSKDDEGNYYKVGVSCDNDIKGEWDYNAWTLKLDNVINGTKCRLTFTSTMTQTERDNIIKQGVQTRRNTYRGKDITDLWKSGDLYKQIENGTFDDIYVGDYIKGNNGVTWLIADLDNYLGTGVSSNSLQQHHATIIPANKLQDNRMNPTNSTLVGASGIKEVETFGAYKGSEMYQTTLKTIYDKFIAPDFTKNGENHVITYNTLVTTAVEDTRSNQWGNSDGASSAWTWEDRQLDLMSEVNVYGTTIVSSSFFDVGIDNRQYAIFQLRPELINQDLDGNVYTYWLKAVANSMYFAIVDSVGAAGPRKAFDAIGVRPRFLID